RHTRLVSDWSSDVCSSDLSRVAVGLSFDFDNETPSLRDGQVSPGLMAQGEYGARAGLPRVLRLLDQYQIPATFFIPAMSAKLHRSEERRVGKEWRSRRLRH